MKYYIRRGESEYGPYTIAELQRYVAQGNIVLGDLTRSEGMTEWVPVSQVIGDIPIPAPTQAVPAAGGMVAGSAPYGMAPAQAVAGPIPPDFHWALVLLLSVVTCFLFCWAWFIVEAAWIRKINPQSRALMLAIVALAINIGGSIFNITWTVAHHIGNPFAPLASFATLALVIVTSFMMRTELEQYYNSIENINLRLEGVGSALLTLFFPVFYLQWHFSRIAKWKKTGVLTPQSV